MPINNYPFLAADRFSFKKPIVPIMVFNPANGFKSRAYALIDTGADSTVIPEFIARDLYHKIKHPDVERAVNCGIGGDIEVYMHTFYIDILSTDSEGIVTDKSVIRMPEKFYPVVPGLSITILGQDDFLKNCILTVNYPGQFFSIESLSY